MSKITKESITDTIEGLEQLANSGIQSVYIDMALAGMRQLLAAMDSEPVYQYQSGVYNDDNGETDWYWDDCDKGFYEQYAHDRRRILYRHAQPVVPDAAAVYAQLSDHEKWSTSLENVNHVLNAFRAAMLAAVPSQFHFSEGQVLLAPHIYRELVNDLKNTAQKYAGAGSLREALSQTLSRYIKPQHKS